MARYGMLINTKKCIGCYACRVACQRQNDLLPTQDFIRYEEQDAPCVAVCPTGAAFIGADGIVGVDEGRCIGCKYCMAACPYQVRVHNEKTGTVDKCRFCTVSAETTGTKMCSCVEACLTGARMFGDLDDPDSDISKEIVATNAQPIAGDLTKSKVFYVR